MKTSTRSRAQGSTLRQLFLLVFILLLGLLPATGAGAVVREWSLQPTTGSNGTPNWAPEPNWTWGDGNPMTQDGATWQAMAQFMINPSLTSPYTNLVSGYYSNYYRIWRGPGQTGTDPENQYRNYYLATRGFSNNVGPGYSTALLFKPPESGTYRFELAGKIFVQNETAGWGRITIYTLDAVGTSASELAVINLNEAGGYHSSVYPPTFAFDRRVKLAAGERFCLRIQTVNPSTASAGTSAVNFSPEIGGKFTVSVVPNGTVVAIR